MSQDRGIFPILPESTDGTQLADTINKLNDTIISMNSGSITPAYATEGTVWLDTDEVNRVIKLWDGTRDIEIATYDASGNITFPLETRFDDYLPIDGSKDMTGPLHVIGGAAPFVQLQPSLSGGYPGYYINDVNVIRCVINFNPNTETVHLIANDAAGAQGSELVLYGNGTAAIDCAAFYVGNSAFIYGEVNVNIPGDGVKIKLYDSNVPANYGSLEFDRSTYHVKIINGAFNPSSPAIFLFTKEGTIKGYGSNTIPFDGDTLTNKTYVDAQIVASNLSAASQIETAEDNLNNAINNIRLTARCKFSGSITGLEPPSDGHNIETIRRISTGVYEIVFTEEMNHNNYAINVDAKRLISDSSSALFANVTNNFFPATTHFRVSILDEVGLPLTPDSIYINISGGK